MKRKGAIAALNLGWGRADVALALRGPVVCRKEDLPQVMLNARGFDWR